MSNLGLNKDNLDGLELSDAADVISDVVSSFNSYASANTVLNQAETLRILKEAVDTLAAWHPDYNPKNGVIETE